MKKILFFSWIIACLFSFGNTNKKKKGCKKSTLKIKPAEVWMQYNETKCDNPWMFNWFQSPTEQQLIAAVKSELLGREIAVVEIKSTIENETISCEACTCLNGRHYYVRVHQSEIAKLKALKFWVVNEIPKINDNSIVK